MAVLKEQPHLQVYVECDGEQLPEYDTDENERTTATITKYIEAKSGAEFAVQFELGRPFRQYAIAITLFIDGRHISSRIISDKLYGKAKADIKRAFGHITSKVADGQRTLRKFCFSELQIEDRDDHHLEAISAKKLRSMGTIMLEACYIRHLREIPTKGGHVGKKSTRLGPIPEKALKGETLSHYTELGQAITVPCGSSTRTVSTHTVFDYVHPQQLPFATFNFKYRSKTALQSLLIIPRSPCSNPPQVKEDDVLVNNAPKLKEEVPATSVKESYLKREHSTVVARDEDDDVVFVSATKYQRSKKESGLKREHPDGDGEVIFVSSAKRRQSNVTVNERGVEIINLT